MDIKCPGSGEKRANRWENLRFLTAGDEVKFVLASREDYQWARQVIHAHFLTERVRVLMSPVYGILPASELADWILASGLDIRLQLQLHKAVFGPDSRR